MPRTACGGGGCVCGGVCVWVCVFSVNHFGADLKNTQVFFTSNCKFAIHLKYDVDMADFRPFS